MVRRRPARGCGGIGPRAAVLLYLLTLLGCAAEVEDHSPPDAERDWSAAEWRQHLEENARDLDTLLRTVAEFSTAPGPLPDSLRLRMVREDLLRIERSIPPIPWGAAWAEQSDIRWRYEDAIQNARWGIELMLFSLREENPRLAEYGRYHLRLGLKQLPSARARFEAPAAAPVHVEAPRAAYPPPRVPDRP